MTLASSSPYFRCSGAELSARAILTRGVALTRVGTFARPDAVKRVIRL